LEERLGARMDSRFYGYDDFASEARKALPRLTRADVQAAIRRYLNPDQACVAIVTADAEGFKNDWISNAPSPPAYRNAPPAPDVLEEDRAIQLFPLDVRPETVLLRPAADWLRAPREKEPAGQAGARRGKDRAGSPAP
jgi:zinc protease